MPSQLHGTFADRLTALMTEKRVSARQLESLARVDVRLIRKYRAGRVEPRDPWGTATVNAGKLARALNVEVDELLPPRLPIPSQRVA